MEVKEAVKKALEYVEEAFSEGGLSNLGLEEVIYDGSLKSWRVTVGFSRPWDYPQGAVATIAGRPVRRSYKVVDIRDSDGIATAIRIRKVAGDE